MRTFVYLVALLTCARLSCPQQFLPGVDPAQWDALLKEFVNAQCRVDYARLKKESSGSLRDYTTALAQAWNQPLTPDEGKVLLINAYNAFTIQWVLENYPIESIWSTSAPFTEARHRLGGKMVSLDQIESQLRAMGDPRIHAALVCAARSCPPLRREPYVAGRLDEQLDDNVRQWLADRSLNAFDSEHSQADVSPIFKWYGKDFDSYPGGLEGFLRQYAPPDVKGALVERKFRIRFKDYDWRLNDQSRLGTQYSRLRFAVDWVRNWFLGLGHR
jgi:uncharacterized protein DUF547